MGGYVPPGMNPRRAGTIADLILRRGDIQARRAQTSGDIWGRALAGLGQQIGGAIQQHQERKATEQEDAAAAERKALRAETLGTALGGYQGDPRGFAQNLMRGGFDPKEAMQYADDVSRFQELVRKQQQGEIPDYDEFSKRATGVARLLRDSPETVKQGWSGFAEVLGPGAKKHFGMDLGPEWTDQYGEALGSFLKKEGPGGTIMETVDEQGRPVMRRATEEQLAEGVPLYQEPEQSFAEQVAEREALAAASARGTAAGKPPAPLEEAPASAFEGMSHKLRLAANRAIMSLPGTKHAQTSDALEYALSQGDDQEVGEIIMQAAVEGENVDMKNRIRGRRGTLAALADAREVLKEIKAEGVNTGIIRGTWEDILRKLGKSSNPRLVSLSNQLADTLVQYRRAATGVQFGAKESAEYKRMFPNYSQDMPVNLAAIKGLERAMRTYDRSYWTHKLGEDAAREVGAIPGGGGVGPATHVWTPQGIKPVGGE